MPPARYLLSALAVAHSFATAPVQAQGEAGERLEIWDIALGAAAADLPQRDFIDYACGTNGGPPSRPLGGWAEFGLCPADGNGLHEVYFRYDNDLEYRARAHRNDPMIELYRGTTAYGHDVIVSVLFAPDGAVEGLRIVSDPRTETGRRQSAHTLGNFLKARFEELEWHCSDLPPAPGETPVAGQFVKQRCETLDPAAPRTVLETRYFRKAGQSAFDPHTHLLTGGQFESSARLEIYRRSGAHG